MKKSTAEVDAAVDVVQRAGRRDPSVTKDELLAALQVLGVTRDSIDEVIDSGIAVAREVFPDRLTYRQIGRALGVSRQAVTGRHRRRVVLPAAGESSVVG